MKDNDVRKGGFLYYIHQNMIAVAVDLGYGIIAQVQVKLRGIFVEDSEAVKEYFASWEDSEVFVKHFGKPPQQAFYLVELFVEQKQGMPLLNVNYDLIDKGIVSKWSNSNAND